ECTHRPVQAEGDIARRSRLESHGSSIAPAMDPGMAKRERGWPGEEVPLASGATGWFDTGFRPHRRKQGALAARSLPPDGHLHRICKCVQPLPSDRLPRPSPPTQELLAMVQRKPIFPHVIEMNHQAGERIGCNVYLVYDGPE